MIAGDDTLIAIGLRRPGDWSSEIRGTDSLTTERRPGFAPSYLSQHRAISEPLSHLDL